MFKRFGKWAVPSAALCVVLIGGANFARADDFASQVESYTTGLAPSDFQNSSAALGAPYGIVGNNPTASNYFGFPNVLSPFSPAYQGDELVVVGDGGQLTLKLGHPVIGSGVEIGVISNVGLIDTSYPAGDASNPATSFGGGSTQVSVSSDDSHWVSLGVVNFDLPANYYLNAGPYDSTAPTSPQVADFGKPFTGTLADFNDEDNSQIIQTLNGSIGGTWLDLTGSGLASVSYIQFSIASTGDPTNYLAIDSICLAHGSNPVVPLPPAWLMGGMGLAALAVWRRWGAAVK